MKRGQQPDDASSSTLAFNKRGKLDTQSMLSTVKDYIIRERQQRGIRRVDRSSKLEMSGEAHDEFVMLLERQLMTTEIGYGSWQELEDVEILEGVYRTVERRRLS